MSVLMGIVFFITSFYSNVNFTYAYSKLLLEIHDPDTVGNYYGNLIDGTHSHNARSYDDIELISKALEIVKKEKSDATNVEINKCLHVIGNRKKKFNCIKRIIYKERSDHGDVKPYILANLFDEVPFAYKYKHRFNKDFVDLTKSGGDAKRTFHTLLKFSDDYLDVNDLIRAGTKEAGEEDKKINNIKMKNNATDDEDKELNNIKMKNKVKRLRPTNNFSHAYLDINDIIGTNKKIAHATAIVNRNDKTKNNLHVFKLIPFNDEVKDLRKFGNIVANDVANKKIQRTLSVESDSSSSSASSETRDEEVTRKGKKSRKPKRFQVIDNSVEEEVSSERDTSDETDIPMQRPIETPKKSKKLVFYMQAPGRMFKIRNEGRRRLPHFFPKRYHWDEDEMRNLRDYWFSGPQGKYWGHYKTPY